MLLVDNNSDDSESIHYFNKLNEHPKITLLSYDKPFNYSAINNFAAKRANGEVLALVNNDIEVINPDWLLNMVSHVMRDDIGCVGAKLLYSDNRIQHAGVVMGYGGGAGHGHKYFPSDHYGYMNRLIASQNYSAVTAACLLVTTDDFWAVEGLNEESLAIAFNDVDLCLKVQQLGRRNLYCAEAVLYHHESVSRGHEDTPEKVLRFKSELDYLQARWYEVIKADPAYNPNLTLKRENFAIKSIQER
ncbi:glycosyltransferase family 2 protein [Pseudoalteromonas espejiana]